MDIKQAIRFFELDINLIDNELSNDNNGRVFTFLDDRREAEKLALEALKEKERKKDYSIDTVSKDCVLDSCPVCGNQLSGVFISNCYDGVVACCPKCGEPIC